MTLFFDKVKTHARVQLSRHLRSPAIWWLALAAPIGARFLVPDESASYSVLAVNNATLALDSGVIGLQLGVIMAIILTPLAYIFLRAGPTKTTPWQAENVTPSGRSALALGYWIADSLALWVLMLALAGAGVMLAYFRLPFEAVNPFVLIFALTLIAAPALMVIAALRTIFSMRPWLRKAGGDVLFFFVWMSLISLSAAFFAGSGGNTTPILDVFGFAAPLSGATDYPIDTLIIGSAPVFENAIEVDAIAGVTDKGFLVSRFFWVMVSGLLVFLSGFTFKSSAERWTQPQVKRAVGPAIFSRDTILPVSMMSRGGGAQLQSEWYQLLRPKWFVLILAGVAIAGAILPFRGMAGPAISLLMIFPMTRHGARWRGREMSKLADVLPNSETSQFLKRILASMILLAILCIPSIGQLILSGNHQHFSDIASIIIGLPILAIGLGHITRGAVTARLILLILWYGYLNLGPSPLGDIIV